MHERLPNDVGVHNLNLKEGTGAGAKIIGATALSVMSWEIKDYIVYKTASGSILGEPTLELIADPFTGKWSLAE